MTLGFLFRWSLRDLRAHWIKVGAIALVIAIGTGGYAGLSSNARWRTASYDASYEMLAMYDIRVATATGSNVDQDTLTAVVADLPHAQWIEQAEERLVIPTQVGVDTPDGGVLVRGEIIGSDFTGDGPHVNGYHSFTGRELTEADRDAVLLDRNFARFYDLPGDGALEVSGGRALQFVGQATTPEYFAVAPEGEIVMSEANFAGVFTNLATAQDLAGTPGAVNELIVTITPEADRSVLLDEIDQALAAVAVGTNITTRDDNASYQALTQDVENDQQMFNVLAGLLFVGAVVAAFILIHRLTQQQRREIGVSMALGVPPWKIAVRPLLVSAQIALLGVILGVGVGMYIGGAMKGLLEDFIPLPVWETSFQVALFAGVAAAGFLIPFVATLIPVWRAVRVAPVDAIKPTHLRIRTSMDHGPRRNSFGNSFWVMPMRNLRRAPWRSAFTTLAVALVITGLVAFLGVIDSFTTALDVAEEESAGPVPDRVAVSLDGFRPIGSLEVNEIAQAETVQTAEPWVRVGATLSSTDAELDVLIDLLDLEAGMWRPSIVAGEPGPGLILAEKAAADLGVGVGDTITVRHPVRTGPISFAYEEDRLAVSALHPHPVRTFAYMDHDAAGMMGLEGFTNLIQVDPAPGATEGAVQRELFSVDAVASVQSVTAATRSVSDFMDQFIGIIQFMALVVLMLAALIAFLTASISLDARVREHATMFAFGVRVRTALRMAMTESFLMGVVATALGMLGGLAVVWWMTSQLLARSVPDFGLEVTMRPETLVATIVMGVVAVAIAPLFTVRRMRRMDIPGTLRLVE